jgi:protein-arginine kinase
LNFLSFLNFLNFEIFFQLFELFELLNYCIYFQGVFERLARGIKGVGESVKGESGKEFMLHPKYGYLHSCPTNLGTGMRASVHIDLPGYTKEGGDSLKKRCEELALQPRGTRGESGGQTGEKRMGRLHLTKSETRLNTDKTAICFFSVRPVLTIVISSLSPKSHL